MRIIIVIVYFPRYEEGMTNMTKKDFLSNLDNDKICEDIIVCLKKSKLPLVLWGCGDVADAVYKYLFLNNIMISQIWVDGDTEMNNFYGFKPRPIKEILEIYDKFNVILGHSHYEKGESIKDMYTQINNVYYVFSIHYEQYDKVPYEEIERNVERFINLYDRLADNKSRDNLITYLNTKLTGNVKYIIDKYSEEMSFFDNDVYKLTSYETFLDIGAYNGDTVRDFLNVTNYQYKKILMVEPDIINYIELNKFLASQHLHDVVPSMVGAWNCTKELEFNTGNEQISSINTGDSILKDSDKSIIYVSPLDDLFGKEEISIIKINYFEGVLEALQGCKNIICKNIPKIAVCVGFDIYNVLKVAEFLFSLQLGYKIYLRFNRAMSSTFTLYAVV